VKGAADEPWGFRGVSVAYHINITMHSQRSRVCKSCLLWGYGCAKALLQRLWLGWLQSLTVLSWIARSCLTVAATKCRGWEKESQALPGPWTRVPFEAVAVASAPLTVRAWLFVSGCTYLLRDGGVGCRPAACVRECTLP